MARGNRRERIDLDEADRRFFLRTLGEACAMTDWRVHAWVLMSNHYHLFLETPEASLVAGGARAANYLSGCTENRKWTADGADERRWKPTAAEYLRSSAQSAVSFFPEWSFSTPS
jgi:REP element-mobilizing transposase RayT